MEQSSDPGTPKTRIQSLYTANEIIETVQGLDGATVAEIADEIDSPRSTVHHYVSTLVDCNFLVKEEKVYHLGLRFLMYGEYSRNRKEIYSIGKRGVDKLADKTDEVAQIVVEEQGNGIYLYQSVGSENDIENQQTGARIDLHCTAAGKAILSQKSNEEVETWVENNDLVPYTENTISTAKALFEELEDVREEGVAFDDEEQFSGIRCVAAPVILQTGELLGAVSVSGPKRRLDDDWFQRELPNTVQSTVGVIEANAEYASWDSFE